MAGTSIDMSKVKQLLQLKQSGMSNRQIAKTLGISRDKANEFVKQAESDPLGIVGLLKLDDPVLDKRMHPGNPAYTDERMEEFLRLLPDFVEQLSRKRLYGRTINACILTDMSARSSSIIWLRISKRRRHRHLFCIMSLVLNYMWTLPVTH